MTSSPLRVQPRPRQSRTPVERPVLRARDLDLPLSSTVGPTEASQMVGVSTSTLHTWVRLGRLDAVEVGGRRRFRRAQLEAIATGVPEGTPVSDADRRVASLAAYHLEHAKTMREDVLLAKVRSLAEALGWLSYHTHRSDRSEPGFPDLVLVRGDVVLWRELKSHAGKTTAPQESWLGALRVARQDVAVWRPLDYLRGDVEAALRGSA